jgi:hypothetical protein
MKDEERTQHLGNSELEEVKDVFEGGAFIDIDLTVLEIFRGASCDGKRLSSDNADLFIAGHKKTGLTFRLPFAT